MKHLVMALLVAASGVLGGSSLSVQATGDGGIDCVTCWTVG